MTYIGYSWYADFGEAPVVISPSPRSTTMAEPQKIRKTVPVAPPVPPRQKSIAFESGLTRGLTAPERMKAVTQLAHLLMLAAGIAARRQR